jgi:hypothetical protein
MYRKRMLYIDGIKIYYASSVALKCETKKGGYDFFFYISQRLNSSRHYD